MLMTSTRKAPREATYSVAGDFSLDQLDREAPLRAKELALFMRWRWP